MALQEATHDLGRRWSAAWTERVCSGEPAAESSGLGRSGVAAVLWMASAREGRGATDQDFPSSRPVMRRRTSDRVDWRIGPMDSTSWRLGGGAVRPNGGEGDVLTVIVPSRNGSAQTTVMECEIAALEDKLVVAKDTLEALGARLNEITMSRTALETAMSEVVEGVKLEGA